MESQAGSRPGSGQAASRPASGGSRPASRSSSSGISRPGTGNASRPPSSKTNHGSRPASSRSKTGSRPSSKTSITRSRPGSASSVAWAEENVVQEEGENLEEMEEEEEEDDDEGHLVIKGEDDIPKGCWFALLQSFHGVWSTKDMNEDNNREDVVRTTVRELVLYLIFLGVIVTMIFGGTSPYRYGYTNMMRQHLEKFEEVKQVPDLWQFLLEEWVPALYNEEWYNAGDIPELACPDGTTGAPCKRSVQDKNVLYDNKLLGVARIRQLRLKNDSCSVHPVFKSNIKVCYSAYNRDQEDRLPFGPGFRRFTGADAWRYQSPKELGGSDYWGKIATFSGGGAVQNMDLRKNNTEAIIRELREFLWIDRATRLVAIDFTVYNANVNLFCVIKLAFEFPPTGGIELSSSFRTVKLLRYVNGNDYWVLAFETLFAFFVLYYIIEEVMEIKKVKLEYFNSGWNVMDLCVISVSLFNIAISIYTEVVVGNLLKPLLAEPFTYGDFDTLSWWTEQSLNIFAINIFFAWLKLFKYISFNRTMAQLSETISRCAPDVLAFQFMFLIVFFAYAQYGYLLFGPKLYDFHSFSQASYTLLRTMLGDFDFPAFVSAHKVLGPGYFIFYIFVVFFILLNMFLAIINDTYSEVKAEMQLTKLQFEITDLFARGYNNVLGSVAMRNKMIDVENAIKLANEDGNVTFDEIRIELKKCDFSNAEIEMFFGKSDKDGDGEITIDESNEQFDSDVDSDEDNSDDESRPSTGSKDIVNNREFDYLERKVDKMEHSISSIITKLDAVLGRVIGINEESSPIPLEDAGNATFMLDITDTGEVADFVPGDGTDGNATFV